MNFKFHVPFRKIVSSLGVLFILAMGYWGASCFFQNHLTSKLTSFGCEVSPKNIKINFFTKTISLKESQWKGQGQEGLTTYTIPNINFSFDYLKIFSESPFTQVILKGTDIFFFTVNFFPLFSKNDDFLALLPQEIKLENCFLKDTSSDFFYATINGHFDVGSKTGEFNFAFQDAQEGSLIFQNPAPDRPCLLVSIPGQTFKSSKMGTLVLAPIIGKLEFTQNDVFPQGTLHTQVLSYQPSFGKLSQPIPLTFLFGKDKETAFLQVQTDNVDDIIAIKNIIHLRDIQNSLQLTTGFDIPQLSKLFNFNDSFYKDILEIKPLIEQDGRLHFDGTITLNPKNLSFENGEGVLSFKDYFVKTASSKIKGISGDIHFTSFSPLKTSPDQKLSIKTLQYGSLLLKDVTTYFYINKNIYFHKFEADGLSGKIMGNNLNLNHSLLDQWNLSLEFQDIALESLVDLSSHKNISAKASLVGDALLLVSPRLMKLQKAHFKMSSHHGLIQLDPGESNMSEISLLLQHMTCTSLDVSIDSATSPDHSLQATIKIIGFNPNFLNKHPFEFNITTSGQLDDLIYKTLMNLGMSQQPSPAP